MSPRERQSEILRSAYAALTRDLDALRAADPGAVDLSAAEVEALTWLLTGGPLTQQALAEQVGRQKSTVSRLVDQLVESGLVRRAPNEEDGRSVTVQLTARGRRRAERLTEAARDDFDRLLAELAPGERRTAVEGLALLRDAAERLATA